MPSLVVQLSAEAWFAANRISAYVLLYMLDDPAILAMTFC